MSRTVKDYMDFVANVRDNIPHQTEAIIKRNEEVILDLNRDTQLYDKGINSDGLRLTEYANITKFFKRQEGKPFNRTTLFDTGEFYNGFKLKINYPKLSIYSQDEKSTDLVEKYGGNIFGLIKDNQFKLNYEIIQPELIKYIKQWL